MSEHQQTHITTTDGPTRITVETLPDCGGPAAGYFNVLRAVVDSGQWAALSPAARSVYLVLARFADRRRGWAGWYRLSALQELTSLCQRATRNGLRDLERKGLMEITESGVGLHGGTTQFRLLIPVDSPASELIPPRHQSADHPGTRVPITSAPECRSPRHQSADHK